MRLKCIKTATYVQDGEVKTYFTAGKEYSIIEDLINEFRTRDDDNEYHTLIKDRKFFKSHFVLV